MQSANLLEYFHDLGLYIDAHDFYGCTNMRFCKSLNFFIFLAVLLQVTLSSGNAGADDIVISDPNLLGVVLDGDDKLEITPEGSITPPLDVDGVFSTGDYNIISNHGRIETSGLGHGINSEGFDAFIENFGTITTTGDEAHGIRSTGPGTMITNFGEIRTSGFGAHGIRLLVNGSGGNKFRFDRCGASGCGCDIHP